MTQEIIITEYRTDVSVQEQTSNVSVISQSNPITISYNSVSTAGPTGPVGATGATGVSGFSGYSGQVGPTGAGVTGATGVSGYSGAVGATGPIGPTGVTGPTGVGTTGATGPSGIQGISGYSGQVGPTGVGTTGATGVSGYSGAVGATGATGVSGYSGQVGPTGAGVTGATGVSGYSGASGTSGYSGLTGPTGVQGISGYSGQNGVIGVNGATGATGISGYSGFTGPTGPTGPQGISGFSGINGATGVTGPTGPQGTVGATGATGVSGYSGAIGATGVTGATGVSGYSGAIGVTGATGLQGTSGYSGTSGTSGYSGSVGATGPSGGVSGYSGYSGINGGWANPNWVYNSSTTLTPASNEVRFNNADWSLATTMAFGSVGFHSTLANILHANRSRITFVVEGGANSDNFITFLATSITDNTTYFTCDISQITNYGTASNTDTISGGIVNDGAVGATGATGVSGFSGYSGLTGPTGAGTTGATGVSGYSGQNGTVGATGATGATGISGYSGLTGIGTTGATGPTGVSGYSGQTGPTGVGTTGATGVSGYSGTSGFSGASGTSGYSGQNGTVGATGVIGATGISGYSGINGSVGVTGATGATGVSGYSGLAGYGSSNWTYNTSTAMTPSSGEVRFNNGNWQSATQVSFDSGSFHSVLGSQLIANRTRLTFAVRSGANQGNFITFPITGVTDNTTYFTCDISGSIIYYGSTPSNGDLMAGGLVLDGATGPTGPIGATGAGVTGATGVSGYSGAIGATGATGISGYSGTNGTIGINGVTGPTGATGVSGYSGYSGAPANPGTAAIGEQTISNNGTVTTLTSQNVYYPILAGWTAGDLSGFTQTGGNLTCATDGTYSTICTISANCSASAQNLRFGIFKNNVLITDHITRSRSPATIGDMMSITITGVVAGVVNGDVFGIKVLNETSAGTTSTISYANFSMTAIAGAQGISGYSGAVGATGPVGATGVSGYSGTNGTIGGFSLDYYFDSTVDGNPTAGNIRLNNATPASATVMNISETDRNGVNIDTYIDTLKVGDNIRIVDSNEISKFWIYQVTGTFASTGSPTYDPIPVIYITGNSTVENINQIQLSSAIKGDQGTSGYSGYSGTSGFSGYSGYPGYGSSSWTYNTSTTLTPGSSEVRFNNADWSLATSMAFDAGSFHTPLLAILAANRSRLTFSVTSGSGLGNFITFQITSVTDNTTYFTCNITQITNYGATPAGGTTLAMGIVNDGISGYSGASGISGYSGASGISGYSGASGISGASGTSGYSGISGYSGSAAGSYAQRYVPATTGSIIFRTVGGTNANVILGNGWVDSITNGFTITNGNIQPANTGVYSLEYIGAWMSNATNSTYNLNFFTSDTVMSPVVTTVRCISANIPVTFTAHAIASITAGSNITVRATSLTSNTIMTVTNAAIIVTQV